jgi:excisionase family DNA binding protein
MKEKAKPSDQRRFVGRIRAAELLDCSPQLIDKFIRLGRLRAFRLGRKVVVRHDELCKLVEANEINA